MNNWVDLTEYLVSCRKATLGCPAAVPENVAMVEFDKYNTRRDETINCRQNSAGVDENKQE
jgi:hypothetical protein